MALALAENEPELPQHYLGVCAFIHVGSDEDLMWSNSLLKQLHEGDTIAAIISSFATAPASVPTACIDKMPTDA